MRGHPDPRDGAAPGPGAARRALAPLGSVAAFSWPVLAVYCPLGVLIQAPGNVVIYGGPAALWVLSSILGMVVLTAVLVAARAWTSRRGGPSPSGVIACYVLAAVVQAVTFGTATVVLGAADAPHLGFRLSGLLFQVPLLVAVGSAVTRHDAHRRIVAELQHTREELLRVGRSLDRQLDRVAGELAAAVRESLAPAVTSLEAALAKVSAGGERAEAVGAIDAIVEERVRPLAHELAAEAEAEAPGELADTALRTRARVPLPARFRPAEAIRPGLAALILSIAALPTAVRALGPLEALLYVTTFVAFTWGLLTAVKRALGSARVRTALGVPAVVGLYAGAGSAAFWLTGAVGVARPAGIAVSAPAFFALIGIAIGAELLVSARRARSERELAAETASLEQAVALVRRREHLVRRRLAFVVHGALQGALHAAAMRLAGPEALTEQLSQEIRRDLDQALSQVDGGPDPRASLRAATTISELASVWEGHRRFHTRLDASAEEALSGDLDADEAVAEVIREAVNNAFRHGTAAAVEVEVTSATNYTSQGAGEIAVAVSDDGCGPSGTSRPGLGSTLFDDLCRDWWLESDARGTRFEARIVLSAPHDAGGEARSTPAGGDIRAERQDSADDRLSEPAPRVPQAT